MYSDIQDKMIEDIEELYSTSGMCESHDISHVLVVADHIEEALKLDNVDDSQY